MPTLLQVLATFRKPDVNEYLQNVSDIVCPNMDGIDLEGGEISDPTYEEEEIG